MAVLVNRYRIQTANGLLWNGARTEGNRRAGDRQRNRLEQFGQQIVVLVWTFSWFPVLHTTELHILSAELVGRKLATALALWTHQFGRGSQWTAFEAFGSHRIENYGERSAPGAARHSACVRSAMVCHTFNGFTLAQRKVERLQRWAEWVSCDQCGNETNLIFLQTSSFFSFGSNLRDSLLFDFGAMLMTKDSFWVFGLDYLEQCSDGNGAIELFLSKLNIQNEKQALKVVNITKKRGLVDVGEWKSYFGFLILAKIIKKNSIYDQQNEKYAEFKQWRALTTAGMAMLSIGRYDHKTTFMLQP